MQKRAIVRMGASVVKRGASVVLFAIVASVGVGAQPAFVPLDRETPPGYFIACPHVAVAYAQRDKTNAFVLDNHLPTTAEEQVAARCFPDEDGRSSHKGSG